MKIKEDYSKRYFILLNLKISMYFLIIVRLFSLQITNRKHFKALSQDNVSKDIVLYPKRGVIYDNTEQILAFDSRRWSFIYVHYKGKMDREELIKVAKKYVNLTLADLQNIDEQLQKASDRKIIVLKDNLSQNEMYKIKYYADKNKFFIIENYERQYIRSNNFSNITGYIRREKVDLNFFNRRWYVAKSGLEKNKDQYLKGNLGEISFKVDASNTIYGVSRELPATNGGDVYLTINKKLQDYIVKLFNGYSGCCIVHEVQSGAILAMVSTPSFDANKFTNKLDKEYWQKIGNDWRSPLVNKALVSKYPIASIIKPFIIAHAIDYNFIDENTTFYCPGYIELGGDVFHCWKHKGHKNVNAKRAIIESCDVFFYNLATKMGSSEIHKVAKNYGFNTTHLSEKIGEHKGSIPNKKLNRKWGVITNVFNYIGQGNWNVTAMGISHAMTVIANNGIAPKYHLTSYIKTPNKTLKSKLKDTIAVYQKRTTLDMIKDSMFQVVNTTKGTAKTARIRDKSWQMSGKTGTAQIVGSSKEDRLKHKKTYWWEKEQRNRDHALFSGFVPQNNPKYVITVIVENGISSAITSAPIAKRIGLMLKNYDQGIK